MEKDLWLSELHEVDKDSRQKVLNNAKKAVTEIGRKLSDLLIEFLSYRLDGDISSIFRRVRESLEPNIQPDHRMLVFDRIFKLLETGENFLRDKYRDDPTVNLKNKTSLEAQTQSTTPEQKSTDSAIDKFCDHIICLEDMVRWVLNEVVSPEMHRESVVKCQLDIFKGFDSDVHNRRSLIKAIKDGAIDKDDDEDDQLLEETMKATVVELWTGLEL